MKTFERVRAPLDVIVRGEVLGGVNAIDLATVGATWRWGRRAFVDSRRTKVNGVLVAVVVMLLASLLGYELLSIDSVSPVMKRKENCKCTFSTRPPITGHWELRGDAWSCERGVGIDC